MTTDFENSGIQNINRKYSLNFNQSGQQDSFVRSEGGFNGSFSLAGMVRKLKLERISKKGHQEEQQSGSSENDFFGRPRVESNTDSVSNDRALFNE